MRLERGEKWRFTLTKINSLCKNFRRAYLKTYCTEWRTVWPPSQIGTVLITDNDEIVSAAGGLRRDYSVKPYASADKLYYERAVRTLLQTDTLAVTGEDTNVFMLQIIAPITVAGDVAGGIILLSENDENMNSKVKMTEVAARIFGSILE